MTAAEMLPPEIQVWRERSLEWLRSRDVAEWGGPGPWWEGTCDSVVWLLTDVEAPFPLPAGIRAVEWGGYQCEGLHGGHCWLEWDGPGGAWILDPTSEQFGLEPFAVVPPGDPRRGCYEGPAAHARRAAEGLEVSW